jgi:4-amino-4-deoxy-L-arabinose transferase-like glycosyltransferase
LRVARLIYPAIFVIAFATYVSRAAGAGKLSEPPEAGDGHDYDAIAYNIWKGQGYGYHWSDPEWRQPYLDHPRYRILLGRQSDYYATTYRPPLLPYLLSIVYAVTDRSFAAWRILNCAIVAGAVTLAAALAAHFAGPWAAPLSALLTLQSPQLTRYSQMFMTEGLAAFLVALLAWTWLPASRKRWPMATAAGSGAVLGALMAARSLYVLWTPIALLMPSADERTGAGGPWRARGICLLTCLVVIAPWWIRNIRVTDAFLPAGSQAGINLPAGFGPLAVRRHGMWGSNPGDGAPELVAQGVNPFSTKFEAELARFRSAQTIRWMREHPSDVIRLMWLHVWQETRPRGRGWWDYLLPLALVAAVIVRKSPGVGIVVLMVAANILSVALTWGEGGRFMVPVLPLLVALVAAALVELARRIAIRVPLARQVA